MLNGLHRILGSAGYRGPSVLMLLALLFLFSGCATTAVWQKWNPEEQKRYFGLTFIEDDDSLLSSYRSFPYPEQRDSCYKEYWRSNDPEGSLLAEHKKRLDKAWNEFGGRMFFNDDRSRIMVRYGEPDKLLKHHPAWRQTSGGAYLVGDVLIEKSWEIWEYNRLGLYFDLIKSGEYFKTLSVTFSDAEYPLSFFKRIDLPAPKPGPIDAEIKDVPLKDFYGARFKAEEENKVRWEIYWRIPLKDVGTEGFTGFFELHKEGKKALSDTLFYSIENADNNTKDPYAYGQRTLNLPPGRYSLDFGLQPEGDSIRYRGEIAAELVSYSPGSKEASDVELAVLQDSTYMSEEFRKKGYNRVIPMFGDTIPAGQPYYIYYEIYNLAVNHDGLHNVVVEYQTFRSDNEGRIKECIVNTPPEMYLSTGNTFYRCTKIHPMQLEPGEYIMVISVKDLISERVSNVTRNIVISGKANVNTGHLLREKRKTVPVPRPPRNPLKH